MTEIVNASLGGALVAPLLCSESVHERLGAAARAAHAAVCGSAGGYSYAACPGDGAPLLLVLAPCAALAVGAAGLGIALADKRTESATGQFSKGMLPAKP